MITDKKQTLNLAESGNCLKPLLTAVFYLFYINFKNNCKFIW